MKRIFFVCSLFLTFLLTNCDEEDLGTETCAGCEEGFPWSVPGSTECYETFDDCEKSERGECTICT